MGLSSKEPVVMVKEEIINDGCKDSGLFFVSLILCLCYSPMFPYLLLHEFNCGEISSFFGL